MELIPGKRYYVAYRIKGVHRKDHHFVGQFCGIDTHNRQIWNLRPAAGTSELDVRHFVSAKETTEPCGPRS